MWFFALQGIFCSLKICFGITTTTFCRKIALFGTFGTVMPSSKYDFNCSFSLHLVKKKRKKAV